MPPSDPILIAVEHSRAGDDLEHLIQNLVRIIFKADKMAYSVIMLASRLLFRTKVQM